MITSNVIHRVFRISLENSTATCFAIDINEKQYIVTSKHVLATWDGHLDIEVFFNGEWVSLPFKLIGHADNGIVVSVLAAPFPLAPSLDLPASNEGITCGHDVYFLGFPYGLSGSLSNLNRNVPFPLVKKAIVSSFYSENGSEVFLLDGHNNPGFSGGPVVFKKIGTNDFSVASVISGYTLQNYPIFLDNQKSELTHQYNTGIIISYSIERAVELTRRNPEGIPVF